jgi:hypothetical protein
MDFIVAFLLTRYIGQQENAMSELTLSHTRSCPQLTPASDYPCTCGLTYRIELQTVHELRNAWEKRAYEAETALAAAQEENRKFLVLFSDYEEPCQDFEMAKQIWNWVLSKRDELREENRKLREQDRRNEVTMGELRRAWEGQNAYIAKLRDALTEAAKLARFYGDGYDTRKEKDIYCAFHALAKEIESEFPKPAEVIYRDETVEQVDGHKDGE